MWGFNFGGLRSFAERRSICSCTNIRTEAAFRMDGKISFFRLAFVIFDVRFLFLFSSIRYIVLLFFFCGFAAISFPSLDWNGNWKFYFNQQRSYPAASFFSECVRLFLATFPYACGAPADGLLASLVRVLYRIVGETCIAVHFEMDGLWTFSIHSQHGT